MSDKRTIPRVCRKCDSAFLASVSAVNKGGALYCSHKCFSLRRAHPVLFSSDGETAMIALTTGDGAVRAYTLVDADDAAFASQWHWSFNSGYATRQNRVNGCAQTLSLHRALLGLSPGDGVEVDHRDRDGLNNRRGNLRTGTHALNTQNKSVSHGKSSAYRGVSWLKARGKWVAYLRANGEQQYLGLFTSEEEAAAAASAARARLMPFAVE